MKRSTIKIDIIILAVNLLTEFFTGNTPLCWLIYLFAITILFIDRHDVYWKCLSIKNLFLLYRFADYTKTIKFSLFLCLFLCTTSSRFGEVGFISIPKRQRSGTGLYFNKTTNYLNTSQSIWIKSMAQRFDKKKNSLTFWNQI